jgi:hypothetical protein
MNVEEAPIVDFCMIANSIDVICRQIEKNT